MMKKNIFKIALSLVMATTLTVGIGVMSFASPLKAAEKKFTPIVSEGRNISVSQSREKFFVDRDSEGYAYNVGDEVEVKISRGYYTVRCRITDRKDGGFLNGKMYYVKPVGKLNDMQTLFFDEGWIYETDIQLTSPQPFFETLFKIAEKVLPFLK